MIAAALARATELLAVTGDTPRLDAELLMAHALGVSRDELLLRRLDGPVPAAFAALLERRVAHEPVAYITGARGFWTIELEVTPDVLIPRPDSETLIEAAVAHFGALGPRTVLDLGTGSGALLLAALDQWPQATGVGLDTSDPALAVARRNADRLGIAARTRIGRGTWSGEGGVFDLILCNPPYVAIDETLPLEVRHEPAAALFAGVDGLDAYRALAPVLGRQIARGGLAAIEIGVSQREAVRGLLRAAGLESVARGDLAGRDRCVLVHG